MDGGDYPSQYSFLFFGIFRVSILIIDMIIGEKVVRVVVNLLAESIIFFFKAISMKLYYDQFDITLVIIKRAYRIGNCL